MHSISFQTFFVQAVKIVVDSWKFSILLLNILWEDWPIFMISASNEELQQQLEYTLLKPDCYSRWILKMQSDTFEKRHAIKFCFKLGKNATEHKRFKEGRETLRDDERCGRSKEVNTPQIGQRVRVTMLRFLGSSGRDSKGSGQHSSNLVSGISTTPSLSQTIWPRWASR